MGVSIYVTRALPQPAIDLLRAHCEQVDISPHDRAMTREELIDAVRGRDGILSTLMETIDDEVMAATGARCKVIANFAVGYNNIDLVAARRRGIVVTNTPGVLTEATADMTWALLFAAARRVVESDGVMRSGKWSGWGPTQFLGQDITGQTLGILGAGRIGTNVALKSAGFRMKVIYTSRSRNEILEKQLGATKVSLDDLLRLSDFVSIHLPLTSETRHMIGARELALMKPTAVLVNTARGPIVDEAALVAALREKRIAAAGLDVYENEPAAAPGLLDLPNVVACPHTGSATVATRTRMAMMAAENLIAVLDGRAPLNPV